MSAPGVGRFLDAVDARLNSNTLLLAWALPAPPADGGAALAAALAHPSFDEALRRADAGRGWHNLPATGSAVRPGARPDLTRLGRDALLVRLEWMVAVGGNWYGTAADLDGPGARALAQGLLDALGAGEGWAWSAVRPDFLHSHAYFDYQAEGPGEGAVAYFDGGGCDGALVGLSGCTLVLLLCNGSP